MTTATREYLYRVEPFETAVPMRPETAEWALANTTHYILCDNCKEARALDAPQNPYHAVQALCGYCLVVFQQPMQA